MRQEIARTKWIMQRATLHVALGILILLFIVSASLGQPSDRIRFNNQDLWLSGGNVAWINFARDIGPGNTNLDGFRQAFEDVRDNGGNAMRLWLHTNGVASPQWSGNTVVGPGVGAIEDLRNILDLAWENQVGLLLCLWSHDMLNIQQNSDTILNRNEAFLRDPAVTQAYIDSALVPMVTALAGHPGIIAWEIFNEPEGITNENGWSTTRHVPMADIQRVVNQLAGAIHRADSTAQVTNGAWAFITTTDVTQGDATAKSADDLSVGQLAEIQTSLSRKYGFEFSEEDAATFYNRLHSAANFNYYRDDRLIAEGGDPDGTLDWYTVHYYTWAGTELSPFHHAYDEWALDKPMAIGEFFLPAFNLPNETGTFGIPPHQLYPNLFDGGYAGAFAWQWWDWWVDREPEKENWPRARTNMQTIKAEHPEAVTINRGMFIAEFSADPSGIEQGQTSLLSWSVFGAETVTINGERVDSAGTREVTPLQDTTFTLLAIDSEGEEVTATVIVEVLDPSELNRAVGRPVFASSGEPNSAEIDPNRAVDGDPDTRWSSAWENDEWIYVDLGETYDINLVRLLWEVAYGSSYDIEVSLDGIFWTTVFEERAGDGQTDEIVFDTPVTARYVRMHGLVKATEWGFSLWEFEVYGLISQLRPPTVAIVAPFEGAIVGPQTAVTISADATDEDGDIAQVAFYVDGEMVGSVDAPPFEWSIDELAEGHHNLSAVATDTDSLVVSSSPSPIFAISTSGFTRYEFEDAELLSNGDMTIQSNVPGASEGEFVDMRDSGTITFDDILVREAGEWLLTFRYYHPYDTFKAQYLSVNGEEVAEIGFAGGLNRWLERGIVVELEQGYNTIEIEKYWGWMYFDYLGIDSPRSGVAVEDESVPHEFSVGVNYPNPFARSTVIPYELPTSTPVRVEVYTITGKRVATLVDEIQAAGRHEVRFHADGLASGIYLYRLTAGARVHVGRLTVTQ